MARPIVVTPEWIKTVHRFIEPMMDDRGCWEWYGALKSKTELRNRYGVTCPPMTQTTYKAHRVVYAMYKEDPGNHLVCHSCDNPSCVNPEHMFLGTSKDNIQDAVKKGRMVSLQADANRLKTHCKRGHEFTEKNTRIADGYRRMCRTCANDRTTAKRKRARELDPEPLRARDRAYYWRKKNGVV